MCVCLPACLPARPAVRLSVCLSACLLAFAPVLSEQTVYLSAAQHVLRNANCLSHTASSDWSDYSILPSLLALATAFVLC